VQDLINTDAIPAFGVPDLLADADAAQQWSRQAMRVWSGATGQPTPELSLRSRDLGPLRRVRADLRQWLVTGDPGAVEVPARAVTVAVCGGRPVYGPRGDGASAVIALVGIEMLLASQAGTVERLRVCANAECSAAFYDQSRNGSRVWHDVKTCGNIANLRAMRARRRETPDSKT
jgi:hypothetical protein